MSPGCCAVRRTRSGGGKLRHRRRRRTSGRCSPDTVGGRVFGYDNVKVDGHMERRINPREAAVVRDIFVRYAKGEGLRTITKALNAGRVPSPRPQNGRPSGWSPTTIFTVVRRELYRGVVV